MKIKELFNYLRCSVFEFADFPLNVINVFCALKVLIHITYPILFVHIVNSQIFALY